MRSYSLTKNTWEVIGIDAGYLRTAIADLELKASIHKTCKRLSCCNVCMLSVWPKISLFCSCATHPHAQLQLAHVDSIFSANFTVLQWYSTAVHAL